MTYFISDIHGEYDLFMQLMEKIRFCRKDKLIVLGDIIDKGPDSVRLLKLLLAQPNVSCILGNHEYDFLRNYRALMSKATDNCDEVLQKMQGWFRKDGKLLDWNVLDALDSLPVYLETDDYICVHAGLSLDEHGKITPLEKNDIKTLVYDRTFKNPATQVEGDKCVLFGHTPTKYVTGECGIIKYPKRRIRYGGNSIKDYQRIHLDTGDYVTGVLGCFCLETCKCFYVKKFM